MTKLNIDCIDFGIRKFKITHRPRHYGDDGSHFFGTINYVDGEIVLEEEHVYDDMLLTLLHEINHAIENIYGVSDSSDCERRVDAYANGFALVMKLNPKLLALFQAPKGR